MNVIAPVKDYEVLNEKKWSGLLEKIKQGKCTPIIGPEIGFATLGNRALLTKAWAEKLDFPFEDCHDLPRVAQFAATQTSLMDAKDEFADRLAARPEVAPPGPEDPHRILASLPLPFYLTTNYDDSLFRALQERKDRLPQQVVCPWTADLADSAPALANGWKPEVAAPVVFHLYGHVGLHESLVLTEDDFLSFLVAVSGAVAQGEPPRIPAPVEKIFTRTVLLFLGYRFRDLDFRILLRFFDRYLKTNTYHPSRLHLCLQVTDDPQAAAPERQLATIREFCKTFCERLDIDVYWGTSQQFLVELRRRWREFNRDD